MCCFQRETLKESKTEYIFITTANKGRTIVITETKNCIQKAERQLTDKDHCEKYRNFTKFTRVEILWKGTVST